MDCYNANDTVTGQTAFKDPRGGEILLIIGSHNAQLKDQTLVEGRQPAGTATYLHKHIQCEEFYYILQARGEMTVGKECRDVVPGDAIAIPPGTAHRLAANQGEDLRFLTIIQPAFALDDIVMLEAVEDSTCVS